MALTQVFRYKYAVQFSRMSSMNLKDLQNQYEGEGIPWRSYCIYYHYLLVNRVIYKSSWIWFFYSSESVLFYTLLLLLYHTLILWAKNTNTDCVSRWEWPAYCTQYYKQEVIMLSEVWLKSRRHITDKSIIIYVCNTFTIYQQT